MTQIHWLNDVSGDFANGANWSGGIAPGAGDGVILPALSGTPYTVTASTAQHVDTLATAADASLVVDSTFQIDNLAGPSRNAGAITIDGELLTEGTFDNPGSLTLGGSMGKLVLEKDLTLTGGGSLIGAANYGYVSGPRENATEFSLTNVDNVISGGVRIELNSFTNLDHGVVDVSSTAPFGGNIYAKTSVVNGGLIENTGTSVFDIQASALDQTSGGTFSASGQGATRLFGAAQVGAETIDIMGGTLATSGTAEIAIYGGIIDGRASPLTIAGTISTASNPRYYFQNDNTGLEGTIVNQGEILDDPAKHGRFTYSVPQLQVIGSATLTGGGEVVLGQFGYLTTAAGAATLTNLDDTITGVGQIGSGNLGAPGLDLLNEAHGVIQASGTAGQSLVVVAAGGLSNAGMIEANSAARLYLEEGTATNSGQIGTSGTGGLQLASFTLDQSDGGSLALASRAYLYDSNVLGGAVTIGALGFLIGAGGADLVTGAVSNLGRLEVVGGTLTVSGAVSGTGLGVISGGVLDFEGAFEQRVQFLRGAGTLRLAQSQSYAGAVFNFAVNGKTALDLKDIGFVGAGEASYSGTAVKGVLTVTDGTHTAQIHLVGDYLGDTFTAASDGHGGTVITAGAARALAFSAAAASFPASATAGATGHSTAAAMAMDGTRLTRPA